MLRGLRLEEGIGDLEQARVAWQVLQGANLHALPVVHVQAGTSPALALQEEVVRVAGLQQLALVLVVHQNRHRCQGWFRRAVKSSLAEEGHDPVRLDPGTLFLLQPLHQSCRQVVEEVHPVLQRRPRSLAHEPCLQCRHQRLLVLVL